jgi:crotonobetainyl-CoA:carnitine CoA-transferase CaiB-like acyl-CoA transferase
MLVDLGADVIKVEPPDGDLTRRGSPRVGSLATYFVQQNCGKRNISLDMDRPEAAGLLARLAETVDVVLENFRAGVMARFGLGYETLSARNPRLVYCSITGYGHTGPWRNRRAYAAVVGAESGLTMMQAQARGGEYANDPWSHGDVYTALEASSGILAALVQRGRTGRGQWVEVSMLETMLFVNEHAQRELAPIGDDEHASLGPGEYPVLPTGDGHYVVTAGHPAERGVFRPYLRAMDRRDLADDPRFATTADRVNNLGELMAEMRAWSESFDDLAEIERRLADNRLAMGVVRSVAEVAATPWAAAREAIAHVPDRHGGTISIPNSPWHFSDAESGARGEPAYRGEHNRQVLAERLGLDDAELDRLEADGVLSSRLPSD